MKTFGWLIIIFSTICMFNSANADSDKNISTRAGKLTIVGEINDMKLLFNGKKLRDGEGFGLSFEKKFLIGDRDVILVMNNSGGTACPA